MKNSPQLTHKWIGPRADEMTLYAKKRDADAAAAYNGQRVIRINFGLSGSWYAVIHGDVIQGENKIRVSMFCLVTPGFVIGLRNALTAENYPWSQEWRESFHDRNMEAFNRPFSCP